MLLPGVTTLARLVARDGVPPTAWAKIAFGLSPVAHARLPTYTASSASTGAKSFSFSALADLPGVVEMRLLPLRVLLHTRRIGDLQVASQVVDGLGRHSFQRNHQEPADIRNPGELDTETEPIVITPQPRHQSLAGVVQIEEPLQIGLRGCGTESP